MPKMTFEDGAEEHIIEAFGWTIQDGIISKHHDDGFVRPVNALDGRPVNVENFGGVVTHPDTGKPAPVRDGFHSIVEYVERQRD